MLNTPAPVVGIEALGDSSIAIGVKPWASVPDFIVTQLEIYRATFEQFHARSNKLPFPQREVRMLGE